MACRRGLIVVLASVLVAPSALAGSNTVFKGAVSQDENSKLAFEVVKNDKGKRRVDMPKVKRLNAACDKGQQELDVKFGSRKDAKVGPDGSFTFDNSGKDYIAVVRGKITGNLATGTLRYQGQADFPSGTQKCDTGEVGWEAEKR